MNQSAAFLIAGTSSGSGKTTLTLGIMAALKARGLSVQPFKCGPDFIDPSLHRMVTGEISSTLDLRMCGRDFCRKIFQRRSSAHDVAVVEGVMGLFDGGIASSAELAGELQLPVVLVVDARSAAESVAAVVKGFEVYAKDVDIAGVIFNRVGSARHRELIERGMTGVCEAEVLGFFPRDIRFEIPDRHLGLYMGEEEPLDHDQLNELVKSVEEYLDIDRLLAISERTVGKAKPTGSINKNTPVKARLAVARDKAFCFYYEDNLEMLAAKGVELAFFSPLTDSSLPPGCSGIYFGGGYPELHACTLSRNNSLLQEVFQFGDAGGIIYGECGGFMYLCETLETIDGNSYAMCGLLPFGVRMKPRLSSLGYRKVVLRKNCLLGAEAETLHGHEFHYSEIVKRAETVTNLYHFNDDIQEGFNHKNVVGGYVHLHFGQSPDAVDSLISHLEESGITT